MSSVDQESKIQTVSNDAAESGHGHGRRRGYGRGHGRSGGRRGGGGGGGRRFTAFALMVPVEGDGASDRCHMTVAFLRSPPPATQRAVLQLAAKLEATGGTFTFTPKGKRSATGKSTYGEVGDPMPRLRADIDAVQPWCRAHGDSETVAHVSDWPFGLERPVELPLHFVVMRGRKWCGLAEALADVEREEADARAAAPKEEKEPAAEPAE